MTSTTFPQPDWTMSEERWHALFAPLIAADQVHASHQLYAAAADDADTWFSVHGRYPDDDEFGDPDAADELERIVAWLDHADHLLARADADQLMAFMVRLTQAFVEDVADVIATLDMIAARCPTLSGTITERRVEILRSARAALQVPEGAAASSWGTDEDDHPDHHGRHDENDCDAGGRAILRANPGMFRVVGVNAFTFEDWVYEEWLAFDQAKRCADYHCGVLSKTHVYDDQGRHVAEGGSF